MLRQVIHTLLQMHSRNASGEVQVAPVLNGRAGPLRLRAKLALPGGADERIFFMAERQLSAPVALSDFAALRFRTTRR